jgi:hypothetical protein
MFTRRERELIVVAYGRGLARGMNQVLDLIEQGVQGEALREQATQVITRTREQHKAGLKVAERFPELVQQPPRGPRLFLVNGKARTAKAR